MNIISDTSGIEALRKRIAQAEKDLTPLLQKAAKESGEMVATHLKLKSPHGRSGGPPPTGDAPGTLAQSFHVVEKHRTNVAATEVQTKQPTKLKFVTEGRGVVRPVRKKALWWRGLAHPVKRSGPSKKNDFVDKVLARTDDLIRPEMQKVVKKLNSIVGA